MVEDYKQVYNDLKKNSLKSEVAKPDIVRFTDECLADGGTLDVSKIGN